jgi:carbon-monoxide dehydrogenase large subunit
MRLPGMLHAVVVRSPIARGRMVRCDVMAVRAAEGVLDVITPSDAAGIRLPCVSVGWGQRETSYPVLDEVIRYVGQPLAVVVARTLAAAVDAADLIDLQFDELPALIGVERARRRSPTPVRRLGYQRGH